MRSRAATPRTSRPDGAFGRRSGFPSTITGTIRLSRPQPVDDLRHGLRRNLIQTASPDGEYDGLIRAPCGADRLPDSGRRTRPMVRHHTPELSTASRPAKNARRPRCAPSSRSRPCSVSDMRCDSKCLRRSHEKIRFSSVSSSTAARGSASLPERSAIGRKRSVKISSGTKLQRSRPVATKVPRPSSEISAGRSRSGRRRRTCEICSGIARSGRTLST